MIKLRSLYLFLLSCCLAANSCSQNNKTETELFVGSTPCDPLIKSSLKIPAKDSCEFIKWELRLPKQSKGGGAFQLALTYGISQPNTNAFKDPKQLTINGAFQLRKNASSNNNREIIFLKSDALQSDLILVKMDSNILHFADRSMKFLVGNGGFSYSLNRISE